jgi:hypothetical protein
MRCKQLEEEIPSLIGTGYDQRPISPQTSGPPHGYNCIAFAFGDTTKWWWPSPYKFIYYWPPHLRREIPNAETIENFILAFEWKGYRVCRDGSLKRGLEKIAIYANDRNCPTHAARQLESGIWVSKCGRLEDVQHTEPSHVEGALYGRAHTFMHRRRDGKPFWRERFNTFLTSFGFGSKSLRPREI